MAIDTQIITIVGRLGRDPEAKFTEGGLQITSFSVACSGRDDSTTWYNVAAFAKLGEICANYLVKGKQVLISGDLNIRTYEKKDGTAGVSYDIRANTMQMLGSKSDGDSTPASAPQASKPVASRTPVARNAPQPIDEDYSSENLPF